MATETSLTFTLGEDWFIDFALNDASGADLDLTGATVALRLKRNKALALEVSSAGSEIGVNSPTLGEGTIHIPPADQAGLVAAVYEYEVRVTLADATVTTQAFGALTLAASLF